MSRYGSDVIAVLRSQRNLVSGLRRLSSVIRNVWAYDWFRPGVKTGFQTVSGDLPSDYMWYSPTETSTARQILKFTSAWFRSYYEYSDTTTTPVFVDFGSGAGKVVLISLELGQPHAVAFELDEELLAMSQDNYLTLSRRKKLPGSFLAFKGDATSRQDMLRLKSEMEDLVGENKSLVLVAYNKNSYGAAALRKSLEALDSVFEQYVYLYQNPVHKRVLEEAGLYVHRHVRDSGLRKNRDWLLATRD